MIDKDTFVLIDAHALIHRAYHAFPATLRTKNGEHINAVYGFTRILLEVITKFKPKYLVCAFDSKGPTFRHTKFEKYKAQRKKTDTELIEQFPRVHELVKAFNIPIVEMAGYEADDILGTLVSRKGCADIDKIIVTGDHDILQLIVYPKTSVYISGNAFSVSTLYNKEGVELRYKFGPEYIIDYKGLRGDPSDNIPGVAGIGEKTATDLILKYGHLEDIYNSLDNIDSKNVRQKLENSREMAYLSKELATINTNAPVDLDISKAEFDDFDEAEVKAIFMEFGFASLINKIPQSRHHQTQDSPAKRIDNNNYHYLTKKEEIEDFLKELKKQKIFAFDTETTGLSYTKSRLLGMSISWKESEGYFIDMDKTELNTDHVKLIKEIFENPNVRIVGHNLKFDTHMLKGTTISGLKLDINLKNFYFDTLLAHYLLTGNQRKNGLKALAFSECKMELNELEDLWKEVAVKIKKNYSEAEIEHMMLELNKPKLSYYACQDADATWRLYKILEKRLEENPRIRDLFFKIEMLIIPVLIQMEQTGIKLDIAYLRNYGHKLEAQLEHLKQQIYECVGHEFNIASSKQVGEVLFGELELPGGKKTKTGAWQTNEFILMSYRNAHPVIDMLLEYREVSKLLSTYINSLILEADNAEQRIHTNYNQTIATTGRLSSTKPNLQNIPVSTQTGKNIRRAFIADKGRILISCDISQQELRILAHLSKEKELIEAFKKDIDIHKNTAAILFKQDPQNITKEQRNIGKTLNYSLIYGISAYGLSERLKINTEEAQQLIDEYFVIYPNVKRYFDELLEIAKETGRVETIYGRYRDASDLKSSNFRVRSATQREVINFPIQGSASDLMKLTMLKVNEFLLSDVNQFKDQNPRMLLQVHDELVFEIDESDKTENFAQKMTEIMSQTGELSVPMRAEYHIGHNWADLK